MAKKKAARKIEKSKDDVISRLTRIEELLTAQTKEEAKIELEETAQISEIDKLEKLEEEIKKDVEPHPLTRITYHDVSKGMVGAFVGVTGHFAFFYGQHIAETLSIARATAILATSIILLFIFLYFSGFRRVEAYRKYLPARVCLIFTTALIVAVIVLFLFDVIHFPMPFAEFYVNVAPVSVLAVMGAATADLIGGE